MGLEMGSRYDRAEAYATPGVEGVQRDEYGFPLGNEPRPCVDYLGTPNKHADEAMAAANRVLRPTGVELVNVSTTYDPYPWQLLDNAWRIIRHVRGEAAEQAAYCRLLEKRISDLEVGGEAWTTYKRVDGEEICGEFGWVADLEYFDGDDEPTELIKEEWRLVSRSTIIVNEREPDEDDDELGGES